MSFQTWRQVLCRHRPAPVDTTFLLLRRALWVAEFSHFLRLVKMAALVQGVRGALAISSCLLRATLPRASVAALQHKGLHSHWCGVAPSSALLAATNEVPTFTPNTPPRCPEHFSPHGSCPCQGPVLPLTGL
jgi:hypothetical protein